MTISTTYFREHLADVISRVADGGEEIILVFGKGKKSKKVTLSPTISKAPKKKKSSMKEFFESDYFKNFQPSPELQNAKDYKEMRDKYYDINDFVV
jgi:hypothetical protein